jgi:uncharacterized membrane protein
MKAIREAITLGCLLLPAALLWLHWQAVPSTLPSHFNAAGKVTAYAPRSFLWLLVGAQAALYLFLLLIARFPRVFNLPAPVGSPNRARMESSAVDMVAWIRLEIVLLFDYLLWAILRVANQKATGLGAAFTFVPATIILLTVFLFLFRMKQTPN